MEMKGEQLIPASQAETWKALNDPEFLKACVPGCEAIDPAGENAYTVLMTARIGPVVAKFRGKLALSDIDAPNAYSLAFEGQGGVAGFAKGSASVRLSAQGVGGTILSYTAKANVGGKLAQVGSRLVDAAAQKVAGDFFAAFNERMQALHGAPALAAEESPYHEPHFPEPVPRDPELPDVSSATLAFFAAGAIVVVVVGLLTLL
jgi:hypothetical protein